MPQLCGSALEGAPRGMLVRCMAWLGGVSPPPSHLLCAVKIFRVSLSTTQYFVSKRATTANLAEVFQPSCASWIASTCGAIKSADRWNSIATTYQQKWHKGSKKGTAPHVHRTTGGRRLDARAMEQRNMCGLS